MSKRVSLVSAFVLSVVVLVTYYPSLRMGFYLDDYIYVERAGRTDWSNALVQIFDPRLQTVWYRPMQAIQFFIEDQIFRGNSDAYHLVNIFYHAINVLLLYALAWRVSKRWIVGFMSALFYATFSVYMSGVSWLGIVDPLAAVFYLSSLWFWLTYLEKRDWPHYLLTFGFFILALLSKQISVTIPIVLFLLDRLLAPRPASFMILIRRYSLFVAAAVAYAVIQYNTQSTQTFAGVFGWQAGSLMLFVLSQYLVLFFFPWGPFPSIDIQQVDVGDIFSYAWLTIAILTLAYITFQRRSRTLVFLSGFMLLTLLPVLPFPFLEHRYLYIPILAGGVLLALLFDLTHRTLGSRPGFTLASSVGLALLALGNGLAVNQSALSAAEWARQLRVPFRDIERRHSTFPRDTFLYFIDPITPTTGGLSGMFFLRYGRDISVGSWNDYARLRDHNVSYVYYFDETRRPHEVPIEQNASTRASPELPVDFQALIRLEGYEVAQTTIQRGSPLILILYWTSLGKLDTNYTVFVHMIDANGQIVAGYDSDPRKGQSPTRDWESYRLVVDAIVLPVDSAVPLGSGYKIELGWYDRATNQRLSMRDPRGQLIGDALIIDSFKIVQK